MTIVSSLSSRCLLKLVSPRQQHRAFTVLALESSADDTCAAVLTSCRQVLANVVVKQHSVHEKFGGIYPPDAIASHQRNLPGAIQQALSDAQMSIMDVDGIAFTRGPGMGGCLSVSSNAAKALAAALHKPLVGIHHMQAHALTPLLSLPPSQFPTFPFLTLLISGGHTLLLLARSSINFRILATTPDDSIGNAYDKISKLLSLPWSTLGPGAALEKFCMDHLLPLSPSTDQVGDNKPVDPELSFPLSRRGELMFSYSGLYSSVQRHVERIAQPTLTPQRKAQIAWAFQRAAIGQLEEKLHLGFKWCSRHGIDIKHVVVSGGVASNGFLRERLHKCVAEAKTTNTISLVFPPVALCTDNAAMVAWAAMYRFLRSNHDPYDIDLRPSWSIEDLHVDKDSTLC